MKDHDQDHANCIMNEGLFTCACEVRGNSVINLLPLSGFDNDLHIKIHATSIPPPCADVMCESSLSSIVKSNSRQHSRRCKFVECNFEMSTPSFQNLSGQIAA